MSALVTEITACRSCGSGSLDVVLDLGTHAVSDFYDKVPEDELRAPLCLVQCEICGLTQLTHSVAKDRLYHDYWYRSGLNPSMVAALKDVVDDAMGRVDLRAGDSVVDIGSNDNTLLDQYPFGIDTWGLEPSDIGRDQHTSRHRVINAYFPTRWPPLMPLSKIVSSIACFYDTDDPNAWASGIKEILHPEGIWVNQMMDLEGMLAANAVDNICHEHVGYWRQADFVRITQRHGLQITDVSHNAVNGGSVRHIVKHGQSADPEMSSTYTKAMVHFARRLALLKGQCLDFLQAARANGKTVLGLGASTKFNTLLQFYGIDPDLLPAIMERNPDKVGKLTAGSHIPIISEEEGRARKPDYLLIGPWHFLESLIERESTLIEQGTRLVVPLPTFRVVN